MAPRGAALRLLAACAALSATAGWPQCAQALVSYSVTTTADSGAPGAPGTLRWAFEQAVIDGDDSDISFNLPVTMARFVTLETAPLPIHTEDFVLSINVSGDGVNIDGSRLAYGSGIELADGSLVLEEMVIRRFPAYGIELNNAHDSRIGPLTCAGSASVRIQDNFLSGVLIAGLGAVGNVVRCAAIVSNGDDGVTILNSAHDNVVEDNFQISANTTNGIKLSSGAYDNEIRRNQQIAFVREYGDECRRTHAASSWASSRGC